MPKLVAIEGPARGKVYALQEREVSIGRSSGNRIAIPDISLSRQHCAIRLERGQYTVRDLESNNGTFVNDLPVHERVLAHRDRIAVGDSVLLFLAAEDDEPRAFVDSTISVGQTTRLSREEAFYLQPERFAESAEPTARLVRDLHSLLRISRELAGPKESPAFARQLLALTAEAIPAQRGAILLGEEPGSAVIYGWEREGDASSRVPISSTVVNRVFRESVGLLSSQVSNAAGLDAAESLRGAGVTAVLAVPIARGERVLGAIYLDTSEPAPNFDKGHLQLLTAISGMAAAALESAYRLEALSEENRELQAVAGIEHNMVGESPALQDTVRLISRVAPTDSTVLIFGESGTGKELAARAIHQNSPRSQKPFVAINCAAIVETLLESELFGHERGAYTGASTQKRGKLEMAHGGTVFLDEIGEMVPGLQAKLLRVLQERSFERVGGTHPIQVDVRIIAATNRDLAAAVKNGAFRQDLFYRLNVVALTVPPLRERRGDIALLASYFLQKFVRRTSARRVRGISSRARAILENHSWPGNVRELENVIERAVVLGTNELIEVEDLPEALVEIPGGAVALDEYHAGVNEARRQIILRALEKAAGNYTQAARLLGIQATYLHRLVRNLNLRADAKTSEGEGP